MFKHTFALTSEEKRKVSEMNSKILLWIMEGRSIDYMSRNLNLSPYQIEHNIDEMLYVLLKQVGKRRFIKTLFRK